MFVWAVSVPLGLIFQGMWAIFPIFWKRARNWQPLAGGWMEIIGFLVGPQYYSGHYCLGWFEQWPHCLCKGRLSILILDWRSCNVHLFFANYKWHPKINCASDFHLYERKFFSEHCSSHHAFYENSTSVLAAHLVIRESKTVWTGKFCPCFSIFLTLCR